MPTLDAILQTLPSKRRKSQEKITPKEGDDVRLRIDEEDNLLLNTNFSVSTCKADPLQGQGEEISPSNLLMSEVQDIMNNPTPTQADIFKVEDSKKRERSGLRLNTNDNLIDINSGGNLIDFNRNKSLPRKAPQHKSGLNYRDPNAPFHNPSRMMPPQNQPPFGNFNPGMPNNMNQNFGPNFAAPFQNFPRPNPNFVNKTWNSASRNPTQNQRMMGVGSMNVNQAYKPKRNLEKKEMGTINSDNEASKAQTYISEDWFSKLEQKGTMKATDGTKNLIDSINHQKNDSFLIELTKKESSNSNHLLEEERTPVAPLLKNFSSDGKTSDKGIKVNDLKRELHLIEKEKEITTEVNFITLIYYRKINLKNQKE